ncbi:MAG: hypothetical protein CVU44_10200 [Chloroflexi bacterium HGW-Chloroflexi-6]|nr:MAG: hypothetical protein CVU44_10200 [Chloroflexi bacterium HGW-Chloroflexi-6]
MTPISISKTTYKRFIIGRQGLWPGRRFAGKDGVAAAIRNSEALQLDPLNVVARSQEIAMWGRVLDFHPEHLYQVAYDERQFFDYGGGLFFYPMEDFPYWRAGMQHPELYPRWTNFIAEHPEVLSQVLEAIRERGPLGNRDFEGNQAVKSYRGRKDTALALYSLWLKGELMVHHRQSFDRYYDLRERVLPLQHDRIASDQEALDRFSRKVVAFLGLTREKRWPRNLLFFDMQVSPEQAKKQLAALYEQNVFTKVNVEGSKEDWIALSSDIALLETIANGEIPSAWTPLGPSTLDEVTFLAPLEIVSARGRAKDVFNFDYIWEVYKPLELRRWGYYTLPILYGDNLVARLDPKLERKTGTLKINGFWLEDEAPAGDPAFADALGKGLARFAAFVGARQVDVSLIQPQKLQVHIQKFLE